ncbi:Cytochrome P450 [Rhypophila sp. PSN 637]
MAFLTTPYAIPICILLLITFYVYRKLHPTPLPGIPHNRDAPSRLFGDLARLEAASRTTTDMSTVVFSFAQELRSPIAQICFTSFSKPWVIIDDPREAEDIVLRRTKDFDRSKVTNGYFRPILPKSTMAQLTTPELKAQKRLWDVWGPQFINKVVARNILAAGKELVELWKIKVGDGASFDPTPDFESTALDVVSAAVLGKKIGALRNEINKAKKELSPGETEETEMDPTMATIRKAMAYISNIIKEGNQALFPDLITLRLRLSPSHRRLMQAAYSAIQSLMRKSCEKFEQINTSAMNEDGEEAGQELDTCVMDLVLRREILTAKRSGKLASPPDPINNDSILQEIYLVLLGGLDSTTNSLTWFSKFAAMFPDEQTKLRDSLYDALGFEHGSDGGKIVEQLTTAKLVETDIPYLDAYVHELIRCSATAGPIERMAAVDTVVFGYHIPKGTHMLLNTKIQDVHVRSLKDIPETTRSATSQSAQGKVRGGLLGDCGHDLDGFNPARWLVKNENTGKEVFDGRALPSLAFGGGFRGCPGKKLAVMDLRIMVAVLLLSFEFSLVEDENARSLVAEEDIFRKPKYREVRLRAV